MGVKLVRSNLTGVYLQLVMTMIIWGGTFIAGRIAVQSIGVFSSAFLRFAIAALCLLVMTGSQPVHLSKREWLGIALMGLTGIFAYNAFFLGGLKLLPASRASLIVALNPIAIAIASRLFFQEPLTRLKILGILISLSGVSIIIGKGNPASLLQAGIELGDWLLFGCVASWVSYTLLGKRVLATVSNLTATTYSCILGALMLLPIALHEGLLTQLPQAQPLGLISIAYMGLCGTVLAFLWYANGIRTIGASRTAIFTNLVPTSAVLMGVGFLGEPLTPALAIGGTLVIAGVLLTNLTIGAIQPAPAPQTSNSPHD